MGTGIEQGRGFGSDATAGLWMVNAADRRLPDEDLVHIDRLKRHVGLHHFRFQRIAKRENSIDAFPAAGVDFARNFRSSSLPESPLPVRDPLDWAQTLCLFHTNFWSVKMFFRLLKVVVLALAMSVVSLGHARSVSFDMVNDTGYTLTAVHAGPSSYDEWGPNILDRHAQQGDSVSVTIGLRDAQECRYDFRYEFSDGDAYEEYAVDVCEVDGDVFIIE